MTLRHLVSNNRALRWNSEDVITICGVTRVDWEGDQAGTWRLSSTNCDACLFSYLRYKADNSHIVK